MKKKLSQWQQKALFYRKINDRAPKTKYGYPLEGLLLPNVDFFSVTSGRLDRIAQSFGLERKIARNIIMGLAQNDQANKYLKKMWDKLHYYASIKDEKRFSSLANILLMHSKSMRALMIWRKAPTWYKSMTESKIISLTHEIDDIIQGKKLSLEASQFKIEKSDGSQRTISSPSLAWRVVSHWHYQILWLWLFSTDHIPAPCQHGGVKWKGTKSCLQELERKVLDSKFILEFDLTKFFDRIRWPDLILTACRNEFPSVSSNWILKSIFQAPENLSFSIEEETKKKIALELALFGEEVNEDFINESAIEDDQYYTDRARKRINRIPDLARRIEYSKILGLLKPFRAGVPQGHPLSPLMAVLSLNEAYKELNENLLMYMDDGLIFGNSKETVNHTLQRLAYLVELYTGVAINLNKSKWVKIDGKFVSNLKFLGVEYDSKLQSFFGMTRNGSTKEIPRRHLSNENGFSEYNSETPLNETDIRLGDPREAFRYDFFGAALAFMYNYGSLKTNRKIWKLEARKNSLSSKIQSKFAKQGIILNLANASSYATSELRNLWTSNYRQTCDANRS